MSNPHLEGVPPPVKRSMLAFLRFIIGMKPEDRLAQARPQIHNFLAHPIIKELISEGDVPAQPTVDTSTNPDLQKIQDSLQQLSKAVEVLKKAPTPPPPSNKAANIGKSKQRQSAPLTPPPHTFSAVAGARPPNPSLLVDLAKLGIGKEGWVKPEILCHALNKELAAITPPQLQLVAIRWTAKGNLVITGGPAATPHMLQLTAPHISTSLSRTLNLPSNSSLPQPRPNTKWSKITINGVPTGATSDRSPLPPDECHKALAASNPLYASLSITQKPSWVHPPTSYSPGSVSSLSVAFEDPDGSKLKVLLAEHYLYVFGNRASVIKWKYHQKNSKDKSKCTASKHPSAGDSDNNEDVDHQLSTQADQAWPTPSGRSTTTQANPTIAQSLHQHARTKAAPPCTSTRTRGKKWHTGSPKMHQYATACPQDPAPFLAASWLCHCQAHFPHSLLLYHFILGTSLWWLPWERIPHHNYPWTHSQHSLNCIHEVLHGTPLPKAHRNGV